MDSSAGAEQRHAALLRFLVGRGSLLRPEADASSEWLDDAWRHRVVPLLYHMAEAGNTGLRSEQLEPIEAAQMEAMRVAAEHDANLVHISGLLEKEGIEIAAIKGAATANLDYPAPDWRQYGDLDVLVRPRDLTAVVSVLLDDGWRTSYPLPNGHQAFVHAITLVKRRGWEIDVHQRLAHRSVGLRLPTDEILDDTDWFDIGGTSVRALTTRDRLIHAAIHEGMSRFESKRLSSVADVLLLSWDNTHLADEVIARSDRWHLRPMVERSINRAYLLARLEVPIEWQRAFTSEVQSRDRLIEFAYGSDERRPLFEEVAHLRLMSSWNDRIRYIRTLVSPGDEYERLSGRHGTIAQGRYLLDRVRNR